MRIINHVAAQQIRDYAGDRLVHHDEWESRYPYSQVARRQINSPTRFVGHHHGRSAQIPRVRAYARQAGSDRGGEILQIRYVDYIHRKWAHKFAYALGAGALTGLLYEGRSLWYPHGAHFGDPNKTDFPVYQMLGLEDTEWPTDAQIDAHQFVKKMLWDLFEVDWETQTDHGTIPYNKTSCAGQYRPYIRADRSTPPAVIGDDAMLERIFRSWTPGDIRAFHARGWFGGDPNYYIEILNGKQGWNEDAENMTAEVLAESAASGGGGDTVFGRPVTISPA